ncbi:unnamed protein product [Rhizophagus irregularis]|nr:unnamed protein product [Rhizophagus irregularis]
MISTTRSEASVISRHRSSTASTGYISKALNWYTPQDSCDSNLLITPSSFTYETAADQQKILRTSPGVCIQIQQTLCLLIPGLPACTSELNLQQSSYFPSSVTIGSPRITELSYASNPYP